jgi:hypothetical protein
MNNSRLVFLKHFTNQKDGFSFELCENIFLLSSSLAQYDFQKMVLGKRAKNAVKLLLSIKIN